MEACNINEEGYMNVRSEVGQQSSGNKIKVEVSQKLKSEHEKDCGKLTSIVLILQEGK
jgi:hypothetical protein